MHQVWAHLAETRLLPLWCTCRRLPGYVLKCRFSFRRSGVGPCFCISNKPPGGAGAAGPHDILMWRFWVILIKLFRSLWLQMNLTTISQVRNRRSWPWCPCMSGKPHLDSQLLLVLLRHHTGSLGIGKNGLGSDRNRLGHNSIYCVPTVSCSRHLRCKDKPLL